MHIFDECNLPVAWVIGKVNPPDYSATCIVKGSFKLHADRNATQNEQQIPPSGDLYIENDLEKSCIYESDFACFKPRTDLILYGTCHPPGNQPAQGCRVTFQVGNHKKSLFIFGDREWKKNSGGIHTISEPTPFTEMPLTYENSFGGLNYPNNPHGKGMGKIINKNGVEAWPLPNLEDPYNLITAPTDQPTPACFSPLGRMWPTRTTGKMGTYNDYWVDQLWPYFPSDFDWSFFNCAPHGMQIIPYLSGDETLFFKNLHPHIAQFHSRLPNIRPRCIIYEEIDEIKKYREVNLNLDTLWVDLENDLLQLVWRGVIDVNTDNLDQIRNCLIVQEPLKQNPKPLEYYINLLKQRVQEEQQDELEEELALLPIDESWIEQMKIDFVLMEQEFLKLEELAKEADVKVANLLKEAGIDQAEISKAMQAAQKLSLKDLLKLGAKEEEKLRKTNPELAKKLPPPLTTDEIDEIDRSFIFEPAPEFEKFPDPLTRESCEKLLNDDKSLKNADLSGLDLSFLDFSGRNCQNVDLQKANLKDVNFSSADLSGAKFIQCDLSDIDFRYATLVDADLSKANLKNADLTEAILDDADFSEAVLDQATLKKAHGFRTTFVNASLKQADCSGAVLKEADFEGCNLDAANFHNSILREASMEGVQAIGVNMISADLTGLHASEGSDFTDGMFTNIIGIGSIWEDGLLNRANFTTANLVDADFTNTNLTNAIFYGADMKTARLEQALLLETNMELINLFQGSLEKARLRKTIFKNANLYEVSFYLTEIEDVDFQGANLKMTMLQKKS